LKNPINWFEIYVQDMGRAKAFYETVFDVQLERLEHTEFEMWAFAMDQDTYGAAGALIKIPGYPSGNNSTAVYFHCEDCGATAERAARAGGRIETPKKSVGPYGHIALVIDPEGNIIGLHSMQ
jgi:predicted enzyme related to lactoylglutathione lyase